MRSVQSSGSSPPIEELGLDVRAYNGLKREGIDTVGQLTQLSREELAFRRIDVKYINEINSKLVESGYRLEDEEE